MVNDQAINQKLARNVLADRSDATQHYATIFRVFLCPSFAT
jgi:hypothetical protein